MNTLTDTVRKLATTQNPKLAPLTTMRGLLQHQLFAYGLFETVAIAISDVVEKDPANAPMKGRWEDSAEGYPDAILRLGWIITQKIAIKWLKQNQPANFFLPIFEQGLPFIQ